MSAFMCSADHISGVADILVALAKEPYAGVQLNATDTAEYLFGILVAENAMSLEARYPSDWMTMLPGGSLDMSYSRQLPEGVSFANYPYSAPAMADALKALNCFSYQSCEHQGWDASRSKALVDAAEAVLAKRLAKCHPAYEAAEWGWRPVLTARRRARA